MMPITKAVIPAAGFGTRMLPISKSVPKEMLPLVDKPIIQIVIEELVEAGITDIIIVSSPHKGSLVDYFSDLRPELDRHLSESSKSKHIEALQKIQNMARIAFIEQHGVYGTGTPVLCAEPYLNNQPFIYTFADDFFIAKQNSFKQMIEVYEQYQAPVVACQVRNGDTDYDRYGYVTGELLSSNTMKLTGPMVEHPGKLGAPSEWASLGGFVVTPQVLPYLHKVLDKLQPGDDLFFHTALSEMVRDGMSVMARQIIDAEYFDTGNKLEYMKSAVRIASRHPEIGPQFQAFIKEFTSQEIENES